MSEHQDVERLRAGGGECSDVGGLGSCVGMVGFLHFEALRQADNNPDKLGA